MFPRSPARTVSSHFAPSRSANHPVSRLEPDRSDQSPRPQDDKPAGEDHLRHSVAHCPICEGGLCSVRAFFENDITRTSEKPSHGLILCDECEAIWLQPNVQGVHLYADSESPLDPITGKPLYDPRSSRWANTKDVESLRWSDKIDPSLTYDPQHDD